MGLSVTIQGVLQKLMIGAYIYTQLYSYLNSELELIFYNRFCKLAYVGASTSSKMADKSSTELVKLNDLDTTTITNEAYSDVS